MGKSRACRTLLLTSASEKRLKVIHLPGKPEAGSLVPTGRRAFARNFELHGRKMSHSDRHDAARSLHGVAAGRILPLIPDFRNLRVCRYCDDTIK